MKMDQTFEHRTREYRAGVLLLVVCTLLTVVGYSSNHWVDRGEACYGLWLRCSFQRLSHRLVCAGHESFTPLGDVVRIPQTLITLEIIALIVSLVIAVVINCRRYKPRPRHRYLEAVIGVAGLFGLIGSSLFWSHKNRLDAENKEVTMLSWSFYLVFFNSIIVLGIACGISCNDDIIPGSDDVYFPEYDVE